MYWRKHWKDDRSHLISGNLQGRPGGYPFDDFLSTRVQVTEINMRAAQYIDAIQVVYVGAGSAPQHGKNGGNQYTFCLYHDEKIVRIEGYAKKYIDQLQFFTDKGACWFFDPWTDIST